MTATISFTLPAPLNPEQLSLLAQLGLVTEAPGDAKAEPKPAKKSKASAAAPAEPTMSADEFQAILTPAVKKLGTGAVKDLFAEFGAKKFSDVKPADYAKLAEMLKNAMSTAASAAEDDLTS